jgi:phenylalanine-4-hydroxylase
MLQESQNFESNKLIDRLPPHLKQFIKPQIYEDYTPIDQAVWRYVMRKNVDYLSKHAHSSYLHGLEKTGISIENIPSMYGMNRILKEIGWAAVAVDGFIPPNAFMEFQAYKILVIASDIRQLENIQYTPAPDIIHEAAGHAPIIANPDYAEYLRRLGEVGAKAILSDYDNQMYEAVRHLSIVKESETSREEECEAAVQRVEDLQAMEVEPSEMALIRNLQWWTVEYGLIGDLNDPKLYGAGLLSSIGESQSCLENQVKKRPYSLDSSLQNFDITQPQPQLFVTPDFSYLMQVLQELAGKMSIQKGGHSGLRKLIDSNMIGTIELSTGLQISGEFEKMILNEDREVIFFKTVGPTALAYREKELIGHGVRVHAHGFSSPLGKLKNISLAIEDMGPVDLKAYNFYDGKRLSFEFDSGITVEGLNVTGLRNVRGKLMLIQLDDCTVMYKGEFLYKPEYGVFDMAVGKEIVSAFAGAADDYSFPNLYRVPSTNERNKDKTLSEVRLEELYHFVREYRESHGIDESQLQKVFDELTTDFPEDWLLSLEILELTKKDSKLYQDIKTVLEKSAKRKPNLKTLIVDGLELLD